MNVNDQAFTDVTFATLDNQHVRAHKIILSSGSTDVLEVYKRILMQVSHQNIFEESASRTKYYFVCSNMLVIQCGKGNICKGLVIHIHNCLVWLWQN